MKGGATVIGHNGKPFTTASIGGAIATRAIAPPVDANREFCANRARSVSVTAATARRSTRPDHPLT
jgi:hypothetical protein